ncbi:MAG: hypothetical protein WKG06_25330 [Segetibacter sp.]
MKQGEIWLVSLDPTVGAEIKKQDLQLLSMTIPWVELPLKVIVPVTDWKDR